MRMRSRIAGLTASTALVACAAIVTPASATTTVMGSALALPYQGGVSTSAGTVTIQQSQAGGVLPNPIVSPGTGIVTEWKVRTSDDAALYTLRIFSPAGTNTYTGTGRVVAPQPVPPGTDDAILTYPGNSQPIKQGDSIGLLQAGTPDEGIAQNTTNGIATNVFANLFTGDPADGVPTAFLPDQQHELLLQATVKYCKFPNLVGQPRAAVQAPLTAADCGSATVVEKPTKNAAQVGKVIAQDPAADATAPPGTGVKVEVGVAGKACKKAKKKKGKKGAESAAKKKGGKKGGCKKKKKKKKGK